MCDTKTKSPKLKSSPLSLQALVNSVFMFALLLMLASCFSNTEVDSSAADNPARVHEECINAIGAELYVQDEPCTGVSIQRNESYEDDSYNASLYPVIEVEANHNVCAEEIPIQIDTMTDYEYTLPSESISFATTKSINHNMPHFTFVRIVGGYVCDSTVYDIPSAVDVSILVKDEEGKVIQIISGLSQSRGFINSNIEFADFNFDGYLDMRLIRWQDGAGGLLANEYFWLWDNEIFQFVLNEQLMKIDQASLITEPENQRVIARQRIDASSRLLFYEYYNGVFTLEYVYYLDTQIDEAVYPFV